jgi:hypothetical protein
MSDVNKGKIIEVQGHATWQSAEVHNVRVATRNIATPLLPCAFSVTIGDNVAYVLFGDNTGVVLARCD